MSSFLYGRLTRKRIATPPSVNGLHLGGLEGARILSRARNITANVETLGPAERQSLTIADEPYSVFTLDEAVPDVPVGEPEVETDPKSLSKWVDIVAALVPAEVLALHALAVAFFIETDDKADPPILKITEPGALTVFFFVFAVLAGALTLASAGVKRLSNWVRAVLVAIAFAAWTMLQAGTAFDGVVAQFNLDMSTGVRAVTAAVLAVIVGISVNKLAGTADQEQPA